MDFKQEIVNILGKEIGLSKEELLGLIEVPPTQDMGDYAFPCFVLSKIFKRTPNEIAVELSKKIEPSKSKVIERVVSNGPYLNFFLNKKLFAINTLENIYAEKENFGRGKEKKDRIMIEYPAPNTNKPLHLGHVRNMLLGKSLSNILIFNGYKVIQVNLNNDRGIHICKSMIAYKKWGEKREPDKKSDHFVGDFYVLYAKKVKSDEKLEVEAHQMLEAWEEGNKEVRALWKKMNKWAIDGFNQTYKRFGIKFNKVYNESDHYEKAKEIVLDAYKKGLFKKDEAGNIVAELEPYALSNKVVLRENGTSVYMTQDINLAKIKYDDFKMDRSIYVVGSEQNLHFKQLFKILDLLKFKNTKGLTHLSYGMIALPEGRMKSREGTVVDADNLLDNMEFLAAKEVKKRHKLTEEEVFERAKQIGPGALNFFILKYEPAKDFIFNPKESLSFEGETGPYIQYAHARICSILRKTKTPVSVDVDYSYFNTKEEQRVLKLLGDYPVILKESADSYKPSLVARYLLDLSQSFNEFYHECPIIGEVEELKKARLLLICCTKEVLKSGLALLDISAPERM